MAVHLSRWHALVALEWPQQPQKWDTVEVLKTSGLTKVRRLKKADGSATWIPKIQWVGQNLGC